MAGGMASIFFGSGGNFSSLTPQKVAAAQNAVRLREFYAYTPCTSAIYIAFTATVTGTCAGIFACFKTNNNSAAQTVTASLQQYTGGGWVDVAGANGTVSNQAIAGPNYAGATMGCGMAWVYVAFNTPAAITTDASTWRIKVLSTHTTTQLIQDAAGGYDYAVILSDTTTYSSGDDMYVSNGITLTVDQSFTVTNLILGVATRLQWQAVPPAAYTLTATNCLWSKDAALYAGTANTPIPVSAKGTFNVTTANKMPSSFLGSTDNEISLYGEKPTNVISSLNAVAAGGQKVIVTATDMSAYWSPGDTIWVYGGRATNEGQYTQVETRVISTIVGTTITFTSNLSVSHLSGWGVVNYTRFSNGCGFVLGATGLCWNWYSGPGCAIFRLSGVFSQGSIIVGWPTYASDTARYQPVYVSSVILANVSVVNLSGVNGAVVENLVEMDMGQQNGSISLGFTGATISNVFSAGFDRPIITCTSSILTNVQLATVWGSTSAYPGPTLSLTGCSLVNCKFMYGYGGASMSGTGNTFTGCSFDQGFRSSVNLTSTFVGNRFVNCAFGAGYASPSSFGFATAYQVVDTFNCTFADTTTTNGLLSALSGAYVKAHAYNANASDHRSWWQYGNMVSSGSGLTDTTVHTVGVGKFALRFEPMSSINNLIWSFDVPTGNISGQTMTVACWVKINAAAYYAGAHGKPRLTIDYDNGTTVYAEAMANTIWQLLSVTFVPATSHGQITVTVSGRTDATGSNSYFYVDDFAMLYPAGYRLDIGGLDLWANALPIVPPIATVMSASDVWLVATSTLNGTGTIGKLLTDNVNMAISTRATPGDAMTLTSAYDRAKTALAANEYTAGPTAPEIADAVLDEDVNGHTGWLTKLLSVSKFLGLK